jgi:hypothetical protein
MIISEPYKVLFIFYFAFFGVVVAANLVSQLTLFLFDLVVVITNSLSKGFKYAKNYAKNF